MRLRRFVFGMLLAGFVWAPGTSVWAQDEVEDSGPSLPITQYAVGIVFGGLAIASVLRSSRRQWN